ncbi:hypothetical protein JRO89_XS09G0093300 [Xanthoceras sorbifolium]|uniref:Protein-serine/threonine phosphatase n=1 Tax=Xanthoceras sorbifolium TaxID=99658 RepID=A0ABQ8HKU0_9ROSI|nr:hypothetical protein JRO89_XS09G0093300 [Xanthoceras sorbifolium]
MFLCIFIGKHGILTYSVNLIILIVCTRDCMSSQQLVDYVRDQLTTTDKLSLICERVFDRCLAPTAGGEGCDNMTMILVQFKKPFNSDSGASMGEQKLKCDQSPQPGNSSGETKGDQPSQLGNDSAGTKDYELQKFLRFSLYFRCSFFIRVLMDAEEISNLCESLTLSDEDGPVLNISGKTQEGVQRLNCCLVGKVLSRKRISRDAFKIVMRT